MNRKPRARANFWNVSSICNLPLLLGIAGALFSTPAAAHEFGVGKGAYEDFLSGNQAVLGDLPILLGLMGAGIFASIWKRDGFPLLWPFYAMGLFVGAAIGFSGFIPPVIPTFATVIIIGLSGAAAPNFSANAMRGLFFLIGIMLCNAVLSGHTVIEIPPFAYVGIAFALNIGVAVWAGLASVSMEKLPYGWVAISWRAMLSWLVAISVIIMALSFNGTS